MKTMRKNKSVFQRPDFAISKNELDKVDKFYSNFYQGTKRQIQENIKSFSTIKMLKNRFSKKNDDPSDLHILEIVRRMEKDKLQANIAMNIAEKAQNQAQNMQSSSLIKMIPYLVALLGIIVCISLIVAMRPFELSNPNLIMYSAPLVLFIPLFIWGSKARKDAKVDMLTINMLMQAASAYSSAKMQGKGAVAAIQNLSELRTKSKKIEEKNKKAKKK